MVKNLPEMQETWVQSLGQEDPLEEESMATHSSIVAWRIPWTKEPGRLQSMGSQRVGHEWVTKHSPKSEQEIFALSADRVISWEGYQECLVKEKFPMLHGMFWVLFL